MPIFYRNKLIHIHIPRTGGTTINNLFHRIGDFDHSNVPKKPDLISLYGLDKDKNGKQVELDHLTLEMIREYTSEDVFVNFRAFCVIRDPIDRFISEYLRQIKQNDKRLFKNINDLNLEQYTNKVYEIYFNGNIVNLSHFSKSHILRQSDFINDNLKFIHKIRFENFNSELKMFLKSNSVEIHSSLIENTRLNYSDQAKKREMKSKYVCKVVHEIYRNDFEIYEMHT